MACNGCLYFSLLKWCVYNLKSRKRHILQKRIGRPWAQSVGSQGSMRRIQSVSYLQNCPTLPLLMGTPSILCTTDACWEDWL